MSDLKTSCPQDLKTSRPQDLKTSRPQAPPDLNYTDLVPRPVVNFGFSSCPNDTFAFHALVHDLVEGPRVIPHIDDIEALNVRASSNAAEVTKVSISAYGYS